MRILPTRLSGPLLIAPTVHGDERGFFTETYRRDALADLGLEDEFIQDNHSRSCRGVVRGMHFQVGGGMAKLVRCARGRVLDVVVDVRPGSPTFGEWEAFELDDEGQHEIYVPVGFAHGFATTSDVADLVYKQTAYHDHELERAIAYDDSEVGIAWPDGLGLTPSARDAQAPRLSELAHELPFTYPS